MTKKSKAVSFAGEAEARAVRERNQTFVADVTWRGAFVHIEERQDDVMQQRATKTRTDLRSERNFTMTCSRCFLINFHRNVHFA